MDDATREKLGPPDIKLGSLQIWIHGRQFPDLHDFWDGNWIRVTAHCGSAGASVWVSGPIIHLPEIERWRAQTVKLQDRLTGEAALACMEPELSVSLKAQSLGHIAMEVSITPDNLNQRHWFNFEIDQSYLSALISECGKILDACPIRGERPCS